LKLYVSNKLWKSVVWEKFGENEDILTAIGLVALIAEEAGVCQRLDTFKSAEKREIYKVNFFPPQQMLMSVLKLKQVTEKRDLK